MNEIITRLESYVPSKVKSYSKPVGKLSYECPQEIDFTKLTHCKEYHVGPHKVTLFYTKENPDCLFRYIDRLLWLLQPTKPLLAEILLTPTKKFYPKGRIFGPSHVNTGYSSNKIVVYRKEEWFKVFIHECFHFFNYEKVLFEPELQQRILALFPVDSSVNLYESYCELWARTLNCCILSVCNKVPLCTLMYHESKYAIRHMVNVLHHMGLTYQEIQKPCSYKEDTNVLSYVVLTSILMYQGFVAKHMDIMPSFQLIDAEPYVAFLEQYYQDSEFLYTVQRVKPRVTTTMTLYSI